ncbi:MAG TPA: TIGR04282 family arsenosugar biosynthesis glycosyltransferase [Thermoleophilaceae bacterium]|nr:TIGR04282 family arsenosugar biosynthesis glycosyltransferase [Thermoleophilaceae bacterium]
MSSVALVVIAKAPAPGRSKTRLCPPCTPAQAAALAEAALSDTLAAVAACPARRRVLALDGEPGSWLPSGFELVEQRGNGLGERLAHALAAAGGPALVVGMDTPQLTPGLLQHAAAALGSDNVDAVLGPALDGGYWTIGLKRPDAEVFSGIPMSDADTCRAQCGRLDELGLRWKELMPLNDVDTFADARLVARIDQRTRFAATLQALLEHPAHHEQPMTEAAPGGRLEIPYG